MSFGWKKENEKVESPSENPGGSPDMNVASSSVPEEIPSGVTELSGLLQPKTPYELWKEINAKLDLLREESRRMFWKSSKSMPDGAAELHTDLTDTGPHFQIKAKLPGIKKENVIIEVTEDGIEISATVDGELPVGENGEKAITRWYRHMVFPRDIVPDQAQASLENGVLEIIAPKKGEAAQIAKYKIQVN